jgi:signal transduction histidine kinase
VIKQKEVDGLENDLEQKFIWHENERRRIAAELHDQVGQSLSEIKFRLESALAGFDSDLPVVQHTEKIAQLQEVTDKVRSAIDEVRRIAMNLRPSILDDLGLIPTINWFCREYSLLHAGIHLLQQIDIEEEHIPEPMKIVIFRILQEALTNVLKHAGTCSVQVYLSGFSERIQLRIQDDGNGFDPERRSIGFGLSNMKQRAGLSAGELRIVSAPGAGTLLEARWLLAAG